ncbi:MAG TPA: Ig-like domain repeat protein [Actinocrinis sp.]|nr:Ig-like domain repeat protein [Actinocrinis sp.]
MKQVVDACRKAAPRWLAALVTSTLAFAGVVAVSAATANASTPGVEVYVGYADNLHATPSNFPAPWSNAPGMMFNGCTGSCAFNGGAVRLVNNSSAAATVNSISVTLDTCTFDIWQHNVVIPAGRQLILAQTASGASAGCDNTSGHFDTSNIGPNGANWTGHCTQSGVIPQINATIDNVAHTYADTKQVLNTGGVDTGLCPGGNKSEQWSLVGTNCPVAAIRLTPASQSYLVGGTATMQATVTNSCGTPLQGNAVTFVDLSGPNARLQYTIATDATGTATLPFTSPHPFDTGRGTDTFQALVTNPTGTFGSGHATVTWTGRPTTVTVTGATSGDYNTPVTVAAIVTDDTGLVGDQTVNFWLNDEEMCSTSASSVGAASASCSLTPHEPAGTYTLTASFPGNALELASTVSVPFTVNHKQATLTYTGPTTAANGQPLTLSGVLLEGGGATAISGRSVTFTLGSDAAAQSCTGATDATGAASCTIASVSQPASSASVAVAGAFAGDAFYLPAAASATTTVEF